MKKLIPILLILASPLASAATAKPAAKGTSLPSTAKLLFQKSGSSGIASSSSDDSALQRASDMARDQIQKRIDEGDDEHGPINVEYQCQAVYRVWGLADVRSYSGQSMYATSGTSYSASVTVNVYCDPRDFPQKVAISAMQACEKDPKEACMSKDYMEAFAKIQKTAYYDIYRR